MSKKILGIIVSIAMLAMLIAPVMAGKGQEKLSFELQIFGAPDATSGIMWEAGINVQIRNRDYYIAPEVGETFILIDEGGANEELISDDYLDYEAKMYVKSHPEKGFYVIIVPEIVYIYADTDKQTLRGTLELVSLGKTKEPFGPATSFVGHGTGEFDGVMVKGNTEAGLVIPGNPNPPFVYVQLNRVGTVMGWP